MAGFEVWCTLPEDHDCSGALEGHVRGHKNKVDDHRGNQDEDGSDGRFPVGPSDKEAPAKELLQVAVMCRKVMRLLADGKQVNCVALLLNSQLEDR
eukprot:scaffold17110_cov20-Tisochrysis_lutea.AAC.1